MKTINEQMARLAINKSLLKEYTNSSNERIVYMNDGTEFQIQIFNPYTYNIGVAFSFNEKNPGSWNYGDNLLVIKPGQRVWLERYLNSENKLLFSTYEVGTSKAVQEAIKANGVLTLKFYKEREQPKIPKIEHIYVNTPITTKYYDSGIYYNNYGNSISNAINYCDTSVNILGLSDSITSAASATTLTASASTSAVYNGNNELKSKSLGKSRSMETGRIDKGGYSSQKFNTVYMDFENYPFSTETIHILPMSQKPITSSDLQKLYCPNCGRKLNQKYKFCPYCGAKIKNCPNNGNYVIEKCPNCGRNVRSTMMECPHCGEILR